MSLLLDALKRAEQEKSARQTTTPAAEPPPRVAPVAAAPAPASSSKAMLELQPMAQAERDAHATRNADAREAAANLMQAKLPQAKPASGKVVMILGIVGVVIVLIGAGVGYLWYAMQPPLRAAAPAAERKRAFVPQPIPSTPPPAVAGVDGPAPSIATQADAARVTPIVAPPVEAKSAPEPSPAATAEAPRGDAESQQMLANLLQEAASPVAPPVKFARTERAATVLPEVRSAYAALMQGDLATARRGYLAVLGADAANFDALLGMATIEARLGNREGARAYYRKVLEIDPRNGVALAGLAAIAQAVAPDAVESQLRADLARDPESAALHSTLGGLYASQSRWGEAQAQYFDAYRLEPGSADIAFNLAVSLDHLGQAKAAAQYYGRALEAARAAAAQFDVAAARRRMAELAP